MFQRLMLSALLLTISSCTYIYGDRGVIKDRDTDYLKAESTPPLRMPPGFSSSTVEAHYPISEKNYPNRYIPVNLTPPELETAAKPKVSQAAAPVAVAVIRQKTVTTAKAAPHKTRYIADMFSHPEYITESLHPGQPAQKTTTQAPAIKQAQATTSAIKQADATSPAVKQAENTTPTTKKKYIADYFR